MKPPLTCNVCGGRRFGDFNGSRCGRRRCLDCGSLERHRALKLVLDALLPGLRQGRCLHLAPERAVCRMLREPFGERYEAADYNPQHYARHVPCRRLDLATDLPGMRAKQYDLIVHNHVLEHVPGAYVDVVRGLHRILRPGGCMVFTIPQGAILRGVRATVEGGEHLASDENRIRLHGQKDHVRTFGTDLVAALRRLFVRVDLLLDPRRATSKSAIDRHNAQGIVFVCRRAA
jgi:SAM-dependent methyltransferase